MRRDFMLEVLATAALFAVVGCGSDSDGGSSNTGGSGGSGGGSSAMQCVGNYAESTYAELLAQTQDGDCSSTSDVNTVCSNNMPQVVGNCGKSCLPEADQQTCVAECVQAAVTHGNSMALSTGCLTCYGADVECAKAHCLVPCGTDPTGTTCSQCRIDNGCADDFYACSGLPAPSGP